MLRCGGNVLESLNHVHCQAEIRNSASLAHEYSMKNFTPARSPRRHPTHLSAVLLNGVEPNKCAHRSVIDAWAKRKGAEERMNCPSGILRRAIIHMDLHITNPYKNE
jgi:hypothetical protein